MFAVELAMEEECLVAQLIVMGRFDLRSLYFLQWMDCLEEHVLSFVLSVLCFEFHFVEFVLSRELVRSQVPELLNYRFRVVV